MHACIVATTEHRPGSLGRVSDGCRIEGGRSSAYMLKFEAYIPSSGRPFPHDPCTFPRLKKSQVAAALKVVHGYIKEGKVLGPLAG